MLPMQEEHNRIKAMLEAGAFPWLEGDTASASWLSIASGIVWHPPGYLCMPLPWLEKISC